jgi:hypothetical protein
MDCKSSVAPGIGLVLGVSLWIFLGSGFFGGSSTDGTVGDALLGMKSGGSMGCAKPSAGAALFWMKSELG